MSGRRALIVGAGGLGCPAARVLARAPAGAIRSITFLDDDTVEIANLHRQILHRTADAGRAKAESAADAIRRLAPSVEAHALVARLDAATALDRVRGYDVVLDGTDNFATKFLINDACVLAGIPFVHAAAVRWGGQVLAVAPGAPCYRCLFEEPPPPADGYSCAEAGVVGPAVGVVGALQGEAALRLLEGSAGTAFGCLSIYDGLAGTLRTVEFRRNPLCGACAGDRAIDPRRYEALAC